jgi:hypothetical protein
MSYISNPAIGGVAEMFEYENAVVLGIDQVNTYHPINTAGVVAGFLDGWTFLAGVNGTFTSVANAGGGQITVNTSGAHGMLAGQIVALTSASVVGYRPPNPTIFIIQSVTATSFNVIATFTATATGTYTRGSTLIAGASSAGNYRLIWNASLNPTSGGKNWKIEPLQQAANIDKAASAALVTGAGAACLSAACFLAIAAGDQLTLVINNETDATDVTVIDLNMQLLRYRVP